MDLSRRLIDLYERTVDVARAGDLTTTHLLAYSMPLLMVPLERMGDKTSMSERQGEPAMAKSFRELKDTRFGDTPFCPASDHAAWRFAVVDRSVIETPEQWVTERGIHPCNDLSASAATVIAEDVLLTMRHGLAHGNVVYLDESGAERPGRRVTQLGFVARTRVLRGKNWDGRHRVVVVRESAYAGFLLRWASWLEQFHDNGRFRLAA